MSKLFLKIIKEKLEAEKSTIEKELESFAQRDKKLKDDWDTKFPKFNGSAGSESLEDEAEEMEEYLTRLPLEHNLEIRLRDINLALEKIKKGEYGRCEKCGREIDRKRLEIYPEARFCSKCRK